MTPTKQEIQINLPTPEERGWYVALYMDFARWRSEEPKMPRDEILGHLLVESGVRDHLGRQQLIRVTQALSRALGTEVPK